jgi:hypothetical protein
VYKKNPEKEGYIFHSLWNPEADYSDEYAIVPLRSTYGGTFDYNPRDIFANIIGSTGDLKISGSSWKQLLTDHGISCASCFSDGNFYQTNSSGDETILPNLECNNFMVGGHVLNSSTAQTAPNGSTVYLLPICSHHNSCCGDGSGRNGAGFYMRAYSSGKGIILNSFMQ